MSTVHGITLSDDGTFIMVTVKKDTVKKKVLRIRKWNSFSPLRNFYLLHRRPALAYPTRWTRRIHSDASARNTLQMESGFHISVDETAITQATEIIDQNISVVVPEHMLLLSLPRFFIENLPSSFCSLYQKNGIIHIGIIIEMKLVVVFTSAGITSWNELEGFLGRIERYWAASIENGYLYPKPPFYQLNELPFSDTANFPIIRVNCESDDPHILAATGASLFESNDKCYTLSTHHTRKNVSIFRACAVYLTVTLFILSLSAAGTLALYNSLLARKLSTVKQRYNSVLYNNKNIRSLISKGNKTAEDILRHNTLFAKPTTWAYFLHSIGKNRPEKLFFDRLGSELIRDDSLHIHIAITGWSGNETIVTEFIKTLSSFSLIDNISLSSIKRIPKQEHSCTFKILCRLYLIKN